MQATETGMRPLFVCHYEGTWPALQDCCNMRLNTSVSASVQCMAFQRYVLGEISLKLRLVRGF